MSLLIAGFGRWRPHSRAWNCRVTSERPPGCPTWIDMVNGCWKPHAHCVAISVRCNLMMTCAWKRHRDSTINTGVPGKKKNMTGGLIKQWNAVLTNTHRLTHTNRPWFILGVGTSIMWWILWCRSTNYLQLDINMDCLRVQWSLARKMPREAVPSNWNISESGQLEVRKRCHQMCRPVGGLAILANPFMNYSLRTLLLFIDTDCILTMYTWQFWTL